QRERRRIVAQRDALERTERITGRQQARSRSDERVHGGRILWARSAARRRGEGLSEAVENRHDDFFLISGLPSYACFKALMSSFFICITALITRSDFAVSFSCNIRLNNVGTICHESPYLSFNQPHCRAFLSPLNESFCQ